MKTEIIDNSITCKYACMVNCNLDNIILYLPNLNITMHGTHPEVVYQQ